MKKSELEMDAEGNIVTRPILGWTTAPVAGMAILLVLNYAESPDELKTGGRFLQTIWTPQQALELAAVLTKRAREIIDAPPQGPAN